MKNIKTAIISMNSKADKASNLEGAFIAVKKAAKFADWVVLPELFSYMGPYKDLYAMSESNGEDTAKRVGKWAKELGCVIFAGSIPERPLQDEEEYSERGHKKVFNTLYVFDRDGKQVAKYRKRHLFQLKHDSNAGSYDETDGFIAGDQPCRVELDGWKVGCAICYDLRFPSVFWPRTEAEAVDAWVLPSAFTQHTGGLHWELLCRARAVETQSYFLAANQVGEHRPGKFSYGHSLVCDPWGKIVASTGGQVGIAYAELDHNRIESFRKAIPVIASQRG